MKLFYLLAAFLPAFAAAKNYIAVLNGAQSGCMKAKGVGNAVVTLHNSKLCVFLSYTGLAGTELAAHIHGPAGVGAGSTAGVLYTLSAGQVKNPADGNCFTLSATQVKDLNNGMLYFAVHTDVCPNIGELRGQIFPV
jgi:hypothetical protein